MRCDQKTAPRRPLEAGALLFLEGLLPRLLPEEVPFKLIPHEGKSDLERSIPRKLKAWRDPDARFVVVRDQDSGDCRAIKAGLKTLCEGAGRPQTLIRIACRELEAWFLGDLAAVGEAFDRPDLPRLQAQKKYRAPDRLGSPSRELNALLKGGYGKVQGARALGPIIALDGERSPSFQAFLSGVRRLVEEA